MEITNGIIIYADGNKEGTVNKTSYTGTLGGL